jgi:hypothetical protein
MRIHYHPALSDRLEKVPFTQVPVVVQVKEFERLVKIRVWTDL